MMDYLIDLEVLGNSIKQINASLEELKSCQDRLFMTCWILVRTGWDGEAADRLGERSNELDGRFNSYQGRNESAVELLSQLQTNAQDASRQASSLAAIWSRDFSGTFGLILKSGLGGDVVSLNRSSCGQVYSLCAQLHNSYDQQEQKLCQARSIYFSCNDSFSAIDYINGAYNEIGKVEEKIDQFNNRLKNYESFIGDMESSASAKASVIAPTELFKSQ